MSLGGDDKASHLFVQAWSEDWEDMQIKSSGDDRFAVTFTTKYDGVKFHDVHCPLNGFKGEVNVSP